MADEPLTEDNDGFANIAQLADDMDEVAAAELARITGDQTKLEAEEKRLLAKEAKMKAEKEAAEAQRLADEEAAALAAAAAVRAEAERRAKSRDWRVRPQEWWELDEAKRLPSDEDVAACRDIWGSTGGRLRKWKDEEGWKAPPPKRPGEEDAKPEHVTMKKVKGEWVAVMDEASKATQLARKYGDRLQYKPRFGARWHAGRMVKLDLHANGLEGNVPFSLSDLTELRVLVLWGNKLKGEIPPLLFERCTRLEHVDLSRNQLAGEIPSDVGACVRLRALHLERNKLTGPLPEALGACVELGVLTAHRNELDGPIPGPAFARLTALRELRLHDNKLTGPVPPELAECTRLEKLLLVNNELEPRDDVLAEVLAACDPSLGAAATPRSGPELLAQVHSAEERRKERLEIERREKEAEDAAAAAAGDGGAAGDEEGGDEAEAGDEAGEGEEDGGGADDDQGGEDG